MVNKTYVHRHPSGVYRIGETRVSLDSIIACYLDGCTGEGIVECFPVLTLEQVQGALDFYLNNPELVKVYLKEREAHWEKFKAEIDAQPVPPVVARLRALRAAKQVGS